MALFEIESGKLIPAQIGMEVPGGIDANTLEAVRAQVLEVIEQPLFPVAWETGADLESTLTGIHSLTALDASGQIVSVEIISEMNSASIIMAMARLGKISNYSWYELATLYPGGAEAFQKSWKEFREAMPATHRPGARLYLVAGSIEDNVYAALGMLQSTGLEVHKLSLRKMSNGRTFLESTLIKNRQIHRQLPVIARSRASLRIARQVSAQAPDSLGVKTVEPLARNTMSAPSYAKDTKDSANAADNTQTENREYGDYTGKPLRIVPSALKKTIPNPNISPREKFPAESGDLQAAQASQVPLAGSLKQTGATGSTAISTSRSSEVQKTQENLNETAKSKPSHPVRSYPTRGRGQEKVNPREQLSKPENPAVTNRNEFSSLSAAQTEVNKRAGMGIAKGYQERSRRLRGNSSIPALQTKDSELSKKSTEITKVSAADLRLLAKELGTNTVLLWRDRFGHVVELLLRLDGKLEAGNGYNFDDLQTAFNYASGGLTDIKSWEVLRIGSLQGVALAEALKELKFSN